MRGPGGVHRLLKKGLREFLAHTLLHKNDLVCEQTHKPSDPAFSHLSKAPYWSTARVCYWPRQWERRDGKDGYWNMCCVHPASWINTAHLPHTHLPLYSPHWWSDWITTPPFSMFFPGSMNHLLFSLELWGGSLAGCGDRRVALSRCSVSHWQIPRWDIAARQSLLCVCCEYVTVCMCVYVWRGSGLTADRVSAVCDEPFSLNQVLWN